jgi:hypothetical protein
LPSVIGTSKIILGIYIAVNLKESFNDRIYFWVMEREKIAMEGLLKDDLL